MATIRDQYPSTNQDSTVGLSAYHCPSRGQAFEIDANALLTACEFYLRKDGSPTGNIFAELYAGTGTLGTNCVGTGSALATSANVDVSTLTTSAAMIEFEFDGSYEMVAGTDYVIMLTYSGGDVSNFVRMYRDASSPTHEGNYVWYWDGWYSSATIDFIFSIWGEDPSAKSASDSLLLKITESAALDTGFALTAVQDGTHIDLSWA